MKYFLILLLSTVSFGLYANQVGSGTVGSSASGPMVECQLPNGKVKMIPIVICKGYNK